MARYRSDFTNFTANVLHERIPRHPVTGDLMVDQKVKAVRAEFGECGPEVDIPTSIDPDTGEVLTSMKGAVIRGGFFDSEIARNKEGWTDDEHDAVVRRLDWLCDNQPGFCQRVEDQKVGAPWPTYDTTHHNSIATLAAQLGLVNEALLYERQNKHRDSVIAQLGNAHADQQQEATLTAA